MILLNSISTNQHASIPHTSKRVKCFVDTSLTRVGAKENYVRLFPQQYSLIVVIRCCKIPDWTLG